MNKRLIIIIAVTILILVGLGGLLFLAVKKQNQPQAIQTGPQLKQILSEHVIAPIPSFDGNAIWYFNSEGRLFRVKIDGSGLSEFSLPAVTTGTVLYALWPKTGADFIALTNNNGIELKNYYNSSQKVYLSLPSNIQSLDWMPDSQRILYIWKSSDNVSQQLVMAGADGSGFTKIANVFWPDLQVKASPDGKTALLYRSNIQGDTNKIYSVDLNSGVVSTIIESGKNIAALWLPSGNKFIYAQTQTDGTTKLYLYDSTTQVSTDLNLSTSIDKITVDDSGQTVYAAVSKADHASDVFVQLDLQTLKQTTYFTPTTNLRATQLMLIGNSLYFTNTADLKFYTITK